MTTELVGSDGSSASKANGFEVTRGAAETARILVEAVTAEVTRGSTETARVVVEAVPAGLVGDGSCSVVLLPRADVVIAAEEEPWLGPVAVLPRADVVIAAEEELWLGPVAAGVDHGLPECSRDPFGLVEPRVVFRALSSLSARTKFCLIERGHDSSG
jgi:hypothetical protein